MLMQRKNYLKHFDIRFEYFDGGVLVKLHKLFSNDVKIFFQKPIELLEPEEKSCILIQFLVG